MTDAARLTTIVEMVFDARWRDPYEGGQGGPSQRRIALQVSEDAVAGRHRILPVAAFLGSLSRFALSFLGSHASGAKLPTIVGRPPDAGDEARARLELQLRQTHLRAPLG